MTEDTPSQTETILAYFPGDDDLERRASFRTFCGYDEAKVRYWVKIGTIPQGEHQNIIDRGAENGVRVPPTAFVRHLRKPGRKPLAAAAAG